MAYALSILLTAGCFVHVWQHWNHLFGAGSPVVRREFLCWLFKGYASPLALWILLNAGLLPGFPPIVLEAAAAGIGKVRLLAVGDVAVRASFVIGFAWAATSYAWLLTRVWPRVDDDDRGQRSGIALTWTVLLLPAAVVLTLFGGRGWSTFGAALWLAPIVHYTVPLISPEKRPPTYHRAIVSVKFGRYGDAEAAVIHELENCEDDFDGWMLLADLYANHFNDLPAAEHAIRDLCAQPNVNPSQISVALHRLADWQLKVAENPDAARAALEEICRRLPGTHLARMAGQRIRLIPATPDEVRAQHRGRTLHLPAASEDPSIAPPVNGVALTKSEAEAQAQASVEKLTRDPANVAERESLALIFTERLFQADRGIEQLELLLAVPGQPEAKRAEWLGLLATWHLRYRGDRAAARALWERLVREHPQTTTAFDAQRRLCLMDAERTLRQARATPRR